MLSLDFEQGGAQKGLWREAGLKVMKRMGAVTLEKGEIWGIRHQQYWFCPFASPSLCSLPLFLFPLDVSTLPCLLLNKL